LVLADAVVRHYQFPEGWGRDLQIVTQNQVRVSGRVVGLTWHNPNSSVLVEGLEITIQPVGTRKQRTTSHAAHFARSMSAQRDRRATAP
jgi:hypothetical protein